MKNIDVNSIRSMVEGVIRERTNLALNNAYSLAYHNSINTDEVYPWVGRALYVLLISNNRVSGDPHFLKNWVGRAAGAGIYFKVLDVMGTAYQLPDKSEHNQLVNDYMAVTELLRQAASQTDIMGRIGANNQSIAKLVGSDFTKDVDNFIKPTNVGRGIPIAAPVVEEVVIQPRKSSNIGVLTGLDVPEPIPETRPSVDDIFTPMHPQAETVVTKKGPAVKVSLDYGRTMETYDEHELSPKAKELAFSHEYKEQVYPTFLEQPDWKSRLEKLADSPKNLIVYDEFGIIVKTDIREASFYVDLSSDATSELQVLWGKAKGLLAEAEKLDDVDRLRAVIGDAVAAQLRVVYRLSELREKGEIESITSRADTTRLSNTLQFLFDMNLNNSIITVTDNGGLSPLGGTLELDGGLKDFVGFSKDLYDMSVENGVQLKQQYYVDFFRTVANGLRKYDLIIKKGVITVVQGVVNIEMNVNVPVPTNVHHICNESFGAASEVLTQIYETLDSTLPWLNVMLKLPEESILLMSAGLGAPIKFYQN